MMLTTSQQKLPTATRYEFACTHLPFKMGMKCIVPHDFSRYEADEKTESLP